MGRIPARGVRSKRGDGIYWVLMKSPLAVTLMTADEAVALVSDGDTVAIEGSGGGIVEPDALMAALGRRFSATGQPSGLTLIHTTGMGDRRTKGLSLVAKEGLWRRVIGGHFGQAAEMAQLVADNKIEAYNFPVGVISQLYREIAAGRPGVMTHVGLGTFVDPRQEGGRLNEITHASLVELMEIDGREWLYYRAMPIDVAFIRGTTADEDGYISMEQEAATLGVLSVAQATRNSGGIVIAQVKRLAVAGSLPAKSVVVPGSLVDAVVVHEEQWQTYDSEYNPSFSGDIRVPVQHIEVPVFNVRKVIARRAAMELIPGAVVNLGVGVSDGVSGVAAEENCSDLFTFTVEQGAYGGVPASGLLFGAASNPRAFVNSASQFDYFAGGGLDLAFLGMAQTDRNGNVNVSKYNGIVTGTGGFVDISQGAKAVVFCATFTTGGLRVSFQNGTIKIVEEGKYRKVVEKVDQITFSGEQARRRGQRVIYVTERAVFELMAQGLTLTEIAPGVDLVRDVLNQMEFSPIIAQDLKVMDSRLFEPELMGLVSLLQTKSQPAITSRFRQRLKNLP